MSKGRVTTRALQQPGADCPGVTLRATTIERDTMHIALLQSTSARRFGGLMAAALSARDHVVDPVVRVDGPADATAAGRRVAASADSGSRPDVLLAAGWEAGVAAHLAARDLDVPVVLRLARPGRRPGTDQDRMESALVRSSALVLVPSVGEVDRLVGRGMPRGQLRVLPQAVDTTTFTDRQVPGASRSDRTVGRPHRVGVATPSDGSARAELLAGLRSMPSCDAVALPSPDEWDRSTPEMLRSLDLTVVADDTEDEVATTLAAMACGVPVVAADTGVLADVVADEVTGLLVGPGGMAPAIRSLLPDVMRRESFGLSAVDRVRARFAAEVVAGALEQHLRSVVTPVDEVAGVAS